jgi:hypothetical protein
MPTTAAIIAAIGTTVAVAGTVKSNKMQKKAAASQRQAEKTARNVERRKAFRQAQIQRANATVQGAAAGGLQSSGFSGGVGSISSQVGTSMGASSQIGAINQQTGAFMQKANDWNMIGQLGGMGASIGGQAGGWESMFGDGSTVNKGVNIGGSPKPNNAGAQYQGLGAVY